MTLAKRYVYTHEGTPIELWATPEGLSVRNGKRGNPVVLTVAVGDDNYMENLNEQVVAEAFFAGLTYHA